MTLYPAEVSFDTRQCSNTSESQSDSVHLQNQLGRRSKDCKLSSSTTVDGQATTSSNMNKNKRKRRRVIKEDEQFLLGTEPEMSSSGFDKSETQVVDLTFDDDDDDVQTVNDDDEISDEQVQLIPVQTKQKFFSCTICSTEFRHESTLRRHMTTHTGAKAYTCNKCGDSFNWENHYKRHMQQHYGKCTYPCDKCNEKFVNGEELISHKEKHHSEPKFTCKFCYRNFSQKSYLERHIRNIHRVISDASDSESDG